MTETDEPTPPQIAALDPGTKAQLYYLQRLDGHMDGLRCDVRKLGETQAVHGQRLDQHHESIGELWRQREAERDAKRREVTRKAETSPWRGVPAKIVVGLAIVVGAAVLGLLWKMVLLVSAMPGAPAP